MGSLACTGAVMCLLMLMAFDTQAAISISKHITAPVQAKLPILRELLERGAD